MKTLELKDICGYMPYGLMQKHYKNVCPFAVEIKSHIGGYVFLKIPPKHGKPLLRPMSDLTKEITHEGERFVPLLALNEGWEVIEPRYNVGEIVAVAQRYDSFLHPNNGVIEHDYQTTALASKGWDNKMFVKADLMPHQIQIRDLRIERLQDISDDYFKEGITLLASADDGRIQWGYADEHLRYYMFDSPREAFASLIDKVSGKGTWDRNPFVWRIEFQLVK